MAPARRSRSGWFGFLNQDSFNAWAGTLSVGSHRVAVALFGAMAVVTLLALLVMSPRLAREGALLWFGMRTEGTVSAARLEQAGTFKGGSPRYRLFIDYRFVADDGRAYEGTTKRNDIRTPPSLGSGDRIGVYYSRSDPRNSVVAHNLASDVYGLLLFLPFLAVIGVGLPAWYIVRYRQWRRQSAAAAG